MTHLWQPVYGLQAETESKAGEARENQMGARVKAVETREKQMGTWMKAAEVWER